MIFPLNILNFQNILQCSIFFQLIGHALASDNLLIESIELTKTKKRRLNIRRLSIPESCADDANQKFSEILEAVILQSIDEVFTIEHRSDFRHSGVPTLHKLLVEVIVSVVRKLFIIKNEVAEFNEEDSTQYFTENPHVIGWTYNVISLNSLIDEYDKQLASNYAKLARYRSGFVSLNHYNCTGLIYDCIPLKLQFEISRIIRAPYIFLKDVKRISHDIKLEKKTFYYGKKCKIEDFDSFKSIIKSEEENLNNKILKIKISVRMSNPLNCKNFVDNYGNHDIKEFAEYEKEQWENLLKSYDEGMEDFKRIIYAVFSDFDHDNKIYIVINLNQSLYYRSIVKKCIRYFNDEKIRKTKGYQSLINRVKKINPVINKRFLPEFLKIVDEIDGALRKSHIPKCPKEEILHQSAENEYDSEIDELKDMEGEEIKNNLNLPEEKIHSSKSVGGNNAKKYENGVYSNPAKEKNHNPEIKSLNIAYEVDICDSQDKSGNKMNNTQKQRFTDIEKEKIRNILNKSNEKTYENKNKFNDDVHKDVILNSQTKVDEETFDYEIKALNKPEKNMIENNLNMSPEKICNTLIENYIENEKEEKLCDSNQYEAKIYDLIDLSEINCQKMNEFFQSNQHEKKTEDYKNQASINRRKEEEENNKNHIKEEEHDFEDYSTDIMPETHEIEWKEKIDEVMKIFENMNAKNKKITPETIPKTGDNFESNFDEESKRETMKNKKVKKKDKCNML